MVGESIGGEALGLGVGGSVNGESPGGFLDEVVDLEPFGLISTVSCRPECGERLGWLGHFMIVAEPFQFHQGRERVLGNSISSEQVHQLRQDQAIQSRERMVHEGRAAVLAGDADNKSVCHFLLLSFSTSWFPGLLPIKKHTHVLIGNSL